MRRRSVVACTIGTALLATACGTSAGSGSDRDVGVLRADVARSSTTAPTGPLVDGLTAFGHDLLAAVDGGERKNTVVSPLSVSLAFSMARVGAGGSTADQLDAVLHFPSGNRDAAFNTLTRGLVTDRVPPLPSPRATRSPGSPPAPPVVAVANALFLQQGRGVGAPFLRTLAEDYGAGVRTVDFTSGQAVGTIDDWVRRQTADRIKKLFDSLDPSTQLVIANAVYLKADWAQPFYPTPTSDKPFTLADGTSVSVPTMHQESTLGYAESAGWRAVGLPYAGGDLAMRVLLPTDGTAPADLLTPATLRAVAAGLTDQRITLDLPKWDFGTDVNLVDALGQLGLRAPFGSGADFRGIAPGLFISQAVHRANITVDEWGTEAAAVTGIAMATSAQVPPRITVQVDHPFAFVVVDTKTRTPLFEGTVADPRAS